jgi:DnaJ homolog subfamily C member 28
MNTSDDLPLDDGTPTSGSKHRHRMRHEWRDLIEDLIEEGRQRGVFEDLEGRGRPLDLQSNLYEGSSALTNRLLKENDLRPAWLSNRVAVLEKIDALRSEMGRTWDRYHQAFEQSVGEGQRGGLTIGWDDACHRWEAEIVKLNNQIQSYNLKRPTNQLEILKLRLEDELKRIAAPRYLL